jgi:hypothetical protein
MEARALGTGVGLGAVYGLAALEAVSPVGIFLILWGLAILYVAWVMAWQDWSLAWAGGGLVTGFGVVWMVLLGQQGATCKPPGCVAAAAATDWLEGLAFLTLVLLLASAEVGWRRWWAGRAN